MINVGFGQFEKTKQEIGSTYDNISTGFFEAQKANIVNTWNYNPSMSLWRKKTRAIYLRARQYFN